MVLPLVSDVLSHPFQITGPKAHHSISGLPLEHLAAAAKTGVHFMRGSTLEPPNELTDRERGGNGHRQMHVRLNSADLMDEYPWFFHAPPTQFAVRQRFDLGNKQRLAAFGMPRQMQVDLAIVVLGHERSRLNWLAINIAAARAATALRSAARFTGLCRAPVIGPPFTAGPQEYKR
jgi:hypothetical protein